MLPALSLVKSFDDRPCLMVASPPMIVWDYLNVPLAAQV
jgi:hypothetical protein